MLNKTCIRFATVLESGHKQIAAPQRRVKAMDTKFRIKYLARKTLLTFLGPSELDEHNDPIDRLERERTERFGPRPQKAQSIHIPKRHFHATHAA